MDKPQAVCPLPWSNMIINVDGDVTPCCYWTTYGNCGKAVANVNESGILGSWNAPGYVEARRKVLNGDPDIPCRECMAFRTGASAESFLKDYFDLKSLTGKSQMLSDNVRSALNEYQNGVLAPTALPVAATVVSTAACNIDCTFCNQTPQRVMRLRLDHHLIEELLQLTPYLLMLAWQGGESLLDKRFRRFLENFESNTNPDLVMLLVTNGILMSPEVVEQCMVKFKWTRINFSIDTFDKPLYEKLRRGADYDVVLHNLKYIVRKMHEGRNVGVSVKACLMKSTLPGLADDIVKAKELNVHLGLSPVVAWPPSEALNCFTDYHAQSVGWRGFLNTAREAARHDGQDAAGAFDAERTILEMLSLCDEMDRLNEQTIDLRVAVHPADPGLLDGVWPVEDWIAMDDGNCLAQVLLPFPAHNLVNAEPILLRNGIEQEEAVAGEGRYFLTPGIGEGQAKIVILLNRELGFDPRKTATQTAIAFRPLKGRKRRRRHGGPLLTLHDTPESNTPPIAFLPVTKPGLFTVKVPLEHAQKHLGCQLIDDEAAYYAGRSTKAAIERDAAGPIINIYLMDESA